MRQYTTPGSYIEQFDASAPKLVGVRTDIAGFVGIARSGPLDTPVPVESYRQFVSHFGSYTGAGYLAYAVNGFFANGGRRCWIVRVAAREGVAGARSADTVIRDIAGAPSWRIAAVSEGVWGHELSIRMRQVMHPQTSSSGPDQTEHYTTVDSVSGFVRGSLVRLAQPGIELWRVVSHVDPHAKRLYWRHPRPEFALPYDRPLTLLNPADPVYISALSYRLQVYRRGRFMHQVSDLSLVPEHPRYAPTVLREPAYPLSLTADQSLPGAPFPVVVRALGAATAIPDPLAVDAERLIPLEDGRDGLAELRVADFVGAPASPRDSDEIRARKLRGIRALMTVGEVSVAAVPDILIRPQADPLYLPVEPPVVDPCLKCPPPPEPVADPYQPGIPGELPPVFSDDEIYQVQANLVDQCEQRRDCFALLDVPYSAARNEAAGVGALIAWRQRFETSHGALYHTWIRVLEPRGGDVVRDIPACGHVAGQYARHDRETGVHKAPANRQIEWVQDVTLPVDAAGHGVLNPEGINVIRVEPGRGLRVMGARTLSSDPDWRYVNVRRLIMMIRKALELSTQWAVFEPNDYATRSRLALSLYSFLAGLWQQGALRGDSAEQAFFVRCDEENNPPEERANGRLLAEIGVAPSVPFEFVIMRVGRQGEVLQIAESGQLARAA